MASKSLGQLTLDIVAKIGGFTAPLDKAGRHADKRMKDLQRSGKIAGAALSVAFVAAAGSLALMAKKGLQAADDLGKTADKLGVTTEALAGLRHAADLGGLSVQGMDNAIKFMLKNTSDAARGTGEAKDAFKALGLEADRLKSMKPDQAFAAIVEQLQKLPTAADRANAAMKIFGKSGLDVLTLTGQGLRDASKEAEKFGLAISRDMARKAEDANDAITRLGAAADGTALQVGIALAPAIEDFAEIITDQSFQNGLITIAQTIGDMATAVAKLVKYLGDISEGKVSLLRKLLNMRGGMNEDGTVKTTFGPDRNFPTGLGIGGQFLPKNEETKTKKTKEIKVGSTDNLKSLSMDQAADEQAAMAEAMLDARMYYNGLIYAEEIRQGKALGDLWRNNHAGEIEAADERGQEMLKKMGWAQDVVDSLRTPIQVIQDYREKLDEALEDGNLTLEQHAQAYQKFADDVLGVDTEAITDKYDAMSEFTIQAYRNMQDAGAEFFEDALSGQLDSFEDYAKRFADMLNKMVANYLAEMLLMKTVGKDFAGGWMQAGVGALGSIAGSFGGMNQGSTGTQASQTYGLGGNLIARASGGPVVAGQAYWVGEKGPEPFIPSSNGTIIPNDKALGGSNYVTVNQRDASITIPINIENRDRNFEAGLRSTIEKAVESYVRRSL
jgi:hypothetical protein